MCRFLLSAIKSDFDILISTSDKILFFDNKDDPEKYKTLPDYKKLHQEWKEI